jgi:hypothetical protein
MSDPDRKSMPVFVSYSHQDKKWLERLQVHLKPLVRAGDIDLWDDTRIQPGADWKTEIDRALVSARVAVLLVSADFLASDFIHDEELPVLLQAARKRGTRILPVILSHSLFADSSLARFQAVNAPDRPLEQLAKAGRDKVLSDLARTIAAELSDEAVADAPAPVSSAPRTGPEPTAQAIGPDGSDVQPPPGSPEKDHPRSSRSPPGSSAACCWRFCSPCSPSRLRFYQITSIASWRSAPPFWPGYSAGS